MKVKARIIFDIEHKTFYTQIVDEDNTIISDDNIEAFTMFNAVFKNRLGDVDDIHKEYAVIATDFTDLSDN